MAIDHHIHAVVPIQATQRAEPQEPGPILHDRPNEVRQEALVGRERAEAEPRWGERAVILAGIAINAVAIIVGFAGTAVANFWLALALNGVGWNLMFVSGSTLVTKAYEPAERSKTQAANDFLVYGTAALTSLSAGQLLHRQGWQIVLLTAVIMILAALAGAAWRLREREDVPALTR